MVDLPHQTRWHGFPESNPVLLGVCSGMNHHCLPTLGISAAAVRPDGTVSAEAPPSTAGKGRGSKRLDFSEARTKDVLLTYRDSWKTGLNEARTEGLSGYP